MASGGVNGEDRRVQRSQRLDRFCDRVRDVVELEIEENRQAQFTNSPDAVWTLSREELQPKLETAGIFVDGFGDLLGAVEVGRIDCDEDRVQTTGSCSSATAVSGGNAARRLRSIASIRRRCDQRRVRSTDQVGAKPMRNTIRSRIGSFMSA